MENGPDDVGSSIVVKPTLNNGDLEEMANFPSTDDNPTNSPEVNGAHEVEVTEENEQNSSDCDALVIDESVKPVKKKKKRSSREFRHTNPYFNKSIFELSLYNNKPREAQEKPIQRKKKLNKLNGKKLRDNRKPKLREYVQYLGLQPSVQFKCPRCGSAGFQTLQSLDDHVTKCTAEAPIISPPVLSNNSTNFRVTRKVFLCSSCGTYYENFNLFLHMREVHKRFICLYCLGMFSHPDSLCLHLVTKHNCAPSRYETLNDFTSAHDEPCYAICCDCHTVFNEQDNFITHNCIGGKSVENIENKSDDTSKISDDTRTQPNISISTSENSDNQDIKTECNDISTLTSNQMSNNLEGQETCKDSEGSDCVENTSELNLVEKETLDETKSVIEDENCDEHSNLDSPENSQDKPNSEMNSIKSNLDEYDSTNNETHELEEDYHLKEEEEVDAGANDDMDIEVNVNSNDEEVRKVPKVTLKLPKLPAYNPAEEEEDEEDDYQSEDSEKLTMEVEKECDEFIDDNNISNEEIQEKEEAKIISSIPTAGADIAIIELQLEQPLDKFDIKVLLQKCLGATIATCLYCNHARKICVNGKQLGYHAIAEHRFSAVVNSITAEELIPESFNARIKESFSELENVYFNLECVSPEGGVTFSHMFECFQCRFSTTVHKELYLHNRKLHTKAILLCIMCKTSFYSYSELICHLCPGLYVIGSDVQFRCCLCVSDDLPSAFRLMVHLRKKHHVCDVCLEMCHNQSKLSNHVWKHKLHHLCYRCGIAYRNKPDITKHLFWKHGTESVLCKKCLHKKWPHVYHFCIPPTLFTCEECNLSFSRAVSLKVHKRLHAEEYPHLCTEEGCSEKFISKKLLLKHEFKHRQPIEEIKKEEVEQVPATEIRVTENSIEDVDSVVKLKTEVKEEEDKAVEKPKPKVDVYDLPELNLSESDSSDSETESNPVKSNEPVNNDNILIESQEGVSNLENELEEKKSDEDKPVPVLENVWDDFKNYQANIVKLDILTDVGNEPELPGILTDIPKQLTLEEALMDHDYCARTMDTLKEQDGLPNNLDTSADHDYCTAKDDVKEEVKPMDIKPKVKPGSDSSSDSGSSSCPCGSNCSCSSTSNTSNSSSSSSDSSESDSSSEEGRRKQQIRREKRRQKKTKTKVVKNPPNKNLTITNEANQNITINAPPQPTSNEVTIEESDLETTETDTDEDFYDKQPQKLASKLIAEKREKLLQMAGIGPYINGSMIDSRPSTPNLPEEVKTKKKSKSKKKKKKKSSKRSSENLNHTISHNACPPITISIPKNSPNVTPAHYSSIPNIQLINNLTPSSQIVDDSNTRASKRRRVPNKFYGYSSDEEAEKLTATPFKYKKMETPLVNTQLVVPPLTIKTPQPVPTVEPISIRMSATPGELKVQPLRLPFTKRQPPKGKRPKPTPTLPVPEQDSGSESNTSSSEEDAVPKLKPQTPALYCYCRCPYDEVSEMIGCDSDECAIEWFHFECVGIMVPPKGQWYCPDCRKRKQQRREMLHTQLSS